MQSGNFEIVPKNQSLIFAEEVQLHCRELTATISNLLLLSFQMSGGVV